MDIVANRIRLINEALSRARMPRPQADNAEAHRSARLIAMRSRQEQNRSFGSH